MCLQDEGQDGGAHGWVFLKLLHVAAVLAFGPYSHLHEADYGEEGHGDALRHHGEAQPGAHLPNTNIQH